MIIRMNNMILKHLSDLEKKIEIYEIVSKHLISDDDKQKLLNDIINSHLK